MRVWGWDPHRLLVGMLLGVEHTVAAHVVAVVGKVDRQRVLETRRAPHTFEKTADVGVEILDHRVVRGQVFPHLGRFMEIGPHFESVGVEAFPLLGYDEGKVWWCYRDYQLLFGQYVLTGSVFNYKTPW